MTYVDVGAYAGDVYKRIINSGLKVREAHLVEPNPECIDGLTELSKQFKGHKCTVHNVALGEADGEGFLLPVKGMSHITQNQQETPGLVAVRITTLDELVQSFHVKHISLLKIDVEGHELKALSGAQELLRMEAIDIIYIEAGFDAGNNQQTYYRLLEDFLNNYKYKIFKIYEQTNELLIDSPVLRRVNFAFISDAFARDNPFKLSSELFRIRGRYKSLNRSYALLDKSHKRLLDLVTALQSELQELEDENKKYAANEVGVLDEVSQLKANFEDCQRSYIHQVRTLENSIKIKDDKLDECMSFIEDFHQLARKELTKDSDIPNKGSRDPEQYNFRYFHEELSSYLTEWKKLNGDIQQLRTSNNELAASLRQVKLGLAYQLGVAIIKDLRNPIRWLHLPISIIKVCLSYRSKQSRGAAVSSRKRAFKHDAISSRAMSLVFSGDINAGLRYINKYSDQTIPLKYLLRSCTFSKGDPLIIRNINKYLILKEISPITYYDHKVVHGANSFGLRYAPVSVVDKSFVQPLITALVIADSIDEQLESSVLSIVSQSWSRLEIIVINNTGSASEVFDKLSSLDDRIRVVSNSVKLDAVSARNLAMLEVGGEYVFYHEVGCWVQPNYVLDCYKFILERSVDGVVANFLLIDEDVKPFISPRINDILVKANSGVFLRVRFLREVLGAWKVSLAPAQAWSELVKRAKFKKGRKSTDHIMMSEIFYGFRLVGNEDDLSAFFEEAQSCGSTILTIEDIYENPYRSTDDYQSAFKEVITSKGRATLAGQKFDVCIITNLRFPGGNASSTLDEVRFLSEKGLTVGLIHCPSPNTEGKTLSSRYDGVLNLVDYFYNVAQVNAGLVIFRHPAVFCSTRLQSVIDRIHAEEAVVVVNNSIYRTNGNAVYDGEVFRSVFERLNAKKKSVYPLGPAIRDELTSLSWVRSEWLASFDWTPTFDSNSFVDNSCRDITSPYSIGRHGRDGKEKWLEKRDELRMAYPEGNDFQVKILGGADKVVDILGEIPPNWEVLPFGAMDPADYLNAIDFFVYYPNSNLNEAFGRTVMEAMFSGVACILPPSFTTTFNDMAFFAQPRDVSKVVKRLAATPVARKRYLSKLRDYALMVFGSEVLACRSNYVGSQITVTNPGLDFLSLGVAAYLGDDLIEYKVWVEGGEGNSELFNW